MTKHSEIKNTLTLIPTMGTILFMSLYFVATFFYPGGSQIDKNAVGFSWVNNYWCNLLDEIAINGQKNSAQPIALTAMFILCLALIYFWINFPKYTSIGKGYKYTIQICGTLAMVIGFFLFTKIDHELITNSASLSGLIAMAVTFIGLHKNKWRTLLNFGLLNTALIVANNILYYHKEWIGYLPLVQKITFVTVLLWICSINIKMYRLQRKVSIK